LLNIPFAKYIGTIENEQPVTLAEQATIMYGSNKFMQNNRWQYVAIILLVAASLAFLRWERPLDSCLGDCVRRYHYRAGEHRITLAVTAQQQGDNGAATIAITVDEGPAADLVAYFNYDTLLDIPAGYAYYWWQDSDLYPDLLLTLTDPVRPASYYVGSRDGKVHCLRRCTAKQS
jgi:hypothetical protein